MAEDAWIEVDDLALPFVVKKDFAFNLKEVRDEAERKAILQALSYVQHNMTKASVLLGVTRPTLYHMMDKLGIHIKES